MTSARITTTTITTKINTTTITTKSRRDRWLTSKLTAKCRTKTTTSRLLLYLLLLYNIFSLFLFLKIRKANACAPTINP